MKKRYVTTVITYDDGSKVVRMHSISKLCCCFATSLVSEILSGCVRIVLAVGLCVAGCDLAKNMKATSLVELSKSSEKCQRVFLNLSNEMEQASVQLKQVSSEADKLPAKLLSAAGEIGANLESAKRLNDRLTESNVQIQVVENSITNHLQRCKWCICPCCW